MPLYEYQCKTCGHRFERIQSFSAEDVRECPLCQGEVERLISAPAVQFKGSGFYSTDYAAKPSAKKTPNAGEAGGTAVDSGAAAPAADGKQPAKTESKASPAPAAKSE